MPTDGENSPDVGAGGPAGAGGPTRAPGLLAGRFQLGPLLGSGGSASVFAAVDGETGASVALKTLHPHLARRADARAAFLGEAERMRGVRHPHLVGVVDAGIDGDAADPVVWIALDLAEGVSLAEHVERHGPLSAADAVAVGEGLLRALTALHAADIIHRDVSPSNITVAVDVDGVLSLASVRLLDFGSADAAGEAALVASSILNATEDGRTGVLGNVNYVSPEQARGEPVDERGDLYQAGAVLHFALTGRPPFERADAAQTMRAHVEAPPPVPSVTDPRIPRALDRVVVRAMLKSPADRFASADEMRAALAAAAALPAARPVPVSRTDVTKVLGRTNLTPAEARSRDLDEITRNGAPGHVRSPRSRDLGTRGGRAGWAWAVGGLAAAGIAAAIFYAAATAPSVAVASPSPTAPRASATPTASRTVAPTTGGPADPATTSVPDLRTLTLAAARAALAEAGFVVGELSQADSPRRAETVLSSSPGAGARLARGGAVSLVVASGFNAVPPVAGSSPQRATATLEEAGFVVVFAETAGAEAAHGAVLGTDPAAGASIRLGATVTVLRAAPAASPSPTPPPTTAPTPSATPTHAPSPSPTPVPTP
ncbi:protein kinase domain-containing protein [Microbacterium terricola]|uniref:non-specific serine/threonine protein kinase n=1 Tax=Microbacterium terricola TaxID=344163 RepID=A0ABM8E394_9MICO|nr:PASTA domain-containing protein [Microbacterium terricola]BDV32232.1 hypothetical protein Microterr_28920 [Microbacterium terricola]